MSSGLPRHEYWIRRLGLIPMPTEVGSCNGYFRETYRNTFKVTNSAGDSRDASSTIFFLQLGGAVSRFHKLRSDEQFFHQEGDPMTIVALEDKFDAKPVEYVLGSGEGQCLQVNIPAGHYFCQFFTAPSEDSYALHSIVVSPGFDPRDEQVATKEEMLKKYPSSRELIEKVLTK